MKIDLTQITNWRLASKSKSIVAKPLISVLVDKTVTNKFLVDTLEGKEPIHDGVVICIGEAGDAWQQMPSKLLKTYSVTGINSDGWMICEPRPGNANNCFEITQEFVDSLVDPSIHENRQQDGTYYIIGQYGEQHDDGLRQYCQVGDFILQDRTNSVDVWIVNRKIFLNTYSLKN
jgi:hypothetical protein